MVSWGASHGGIRENAGPFSGLAGRTAMSSDRFCDSLHFYAKMQMLYYAFLLSPSPRREWVEMML